MNAADFEAAGIADAQTARAAGIVFHQARAAQLLVMAHPALKAGGADTVATITLAIAMAVASNAGGTSVGYGPAPSV